MPDSEYFDFQEFPTITVGGPPGDYIARVPVPSNEEADFMIISATDGAANAARILINSSQATYPAAPQYPDYSGASIYSDRQAINGITLIVGINNTTFPNPVWERIQNQIGEVYVHIYQATAAFVSIKFRVKILKKIPAPFRTVGPEDERIVHAMREKKIQEAVLAQEGEHYVYGKQPPTEPIIEPISATPQPKSKLGYWGRTRR
jgi:hypothetical protein